MTEHARVNELLALAVTGEQLYHRAPCGLLTTTRDGLIMHANRTFAQWVHMPVESLIGSALADVLDTDGRAFSADRLLPLLDAHREVTVCAFPSAPDNLDAWQRSSTRASAKRAKSR